MRRLVVHPLHSQAPGRRWCGGRCRAAEPHALLATSLFGDLAAGLYEDASARVLEHPALLRLLNLEPIPPCGSVPPVSLIRPVEVPGIAVLLN